MIRRPVKTGDTGKGFGRQSSFGLSSSSAHNRASRSNNQQTSNSQNIFSIAAILFSLVLFLVYLSHLQFVDYEPPATDGWPVNKKEPSVRSSKDANRITVASVRDDFYRRYGGKQAANVMYEKGVKAFGSVSKTAERMLRAAADGKPFVLSFAGYSVTVGRGNYYSQSYPFVLQRIIEPLVQTTLQIPVTVRNSAIGGIPSFPYGFCFGHFLGDDSHVVSWDYSMNEGKGGAILESYVRHSQSQLDRPMVISLDTNVARCKLLHDYTEEGLLDDALCVAMAKDVTDVKALQDNKTPESKLPLGFQKWNEFGAPAGCPGRSSWHPKQKEHELIGWMMAMYFVDAIEYAQEIMKNNPIWKTSYHRGSSTQQKDHMTFPPPLASKLPENSPQVTALLYGHKMADTDDNKYVMNEISCRTNFLPAVDHDKVLPSIVVSGLTTTATADNILTPRSDEQYSKGWVLDVSQVERETKIKVESCGGLGYVDMKIALYGVRESGPLRLWLPSKGTETKDSVQATERFTELIICEANEKRPKDACKLDEDLTFTVGGVPIERGSVTKIVGAAEYLQRTTCVHVGIPSGAVVTPLSQLKTKDDQPVSVEEQRRLVGASSGTSIDPQRTVGLVVDIHVTGEKVSRANGACCLSHVVWEHNHPAPP